MGRLEGKVAVVTGASSGFGRGIARAFAAEGAKVVVSDVREELTEGGFEEDPDLTPVEAIEKDGGEAIYVGCDVTKQDQVRDLVKAAVDGFGRLDIMVNNAGIYRGGSSRTSSPRRTSTPASTSTSRAPSSAPRRRSSSSSSRATVATSSTSSPPPGSGVTPISRSTTPRRAPRPISPAA